MNSQYVCIVCPVCCRLTVEETDGALVVSGNQCRRGEQHALNEYRDPQRMLTTTVRLAGARLRRLPVIGTATVPKNALRACLAQLYRLEVTAPVRAGQVITRDVCGTGTDVVAARNVEAAQ